MKILRKIFDFILKILKSLWNYVSSSLEHLIIVILIIIVLILGFKSCSSSKEVDRLKNELISQTDSTEVYRNKTGELYESVENYIATASELKKINENLYKEIKNLKDNPLVVSKVEYVAQIDSIVVKDTVYISKDDVYQLKFNYADEYASINGCTYFNYESLKSHTILENIKIWGNIYYDIIEKDKKLYTIVRTDNPYMQINNIESAFVSPENSKALKKQFNKPWGLMIGIGPSVTVMNNTVKVYPSINLTFGYKFLNLF